MLPLALSIDGGSLTYAAAAQRKVIISYFFRIKEVVIVERLLDFLISDFFCTFNVAQDLALNTVAHTLIRAPRLMLVATVLEHSLPRSM